MTDQLHDADHYWQGPQARQPAYVCAGCGHPFMDVRDLNYHIAIVHAYQPQRPVVPAAFIRAFTEEP